MKKLLLILVISSLFQITKAQQKTDSLKTYKLNEVIVTGYDGNRKLLETPGAIGFIPDVRVASLDQTAVVTAFNTIPGVRFEQRAPASYRIAIRGSTLRSPFGVRNVKIYWNDIPLTQPSGGTDLNLLDASNFYQAEVLKGPAGNIYGAGTGGAILIKSFDTNPGTSSFSTGLTTGSYDLRRFITEAQSNSKNGTVNVKYARQLSDGYREQSFSQRDVLEASGRFLVSEKQTLSTSLLYSDLNYGIPGGLTREQFDENPRQARQGNPFVLGSVESNASIDHQALLLGLTNEYNFRSNFTNKTTVYSLFSDFENPFNFDYKRDSRKTGGGRTRFTYQAELGDILADFIFGAEFQAANNVARNFENDSGAVGALNFDDELSSRQTLVFAKGEFELPSDWIITAGASFNILNYNINRVADNTGGQPVEVSRDFDPIIVPRFGVVKKLDESISAHASIGYGFSPPTIEEVRTNEGSINLDLEPEEGVNYEAGIRGNTLSGKLNFDVTGFFFQLKETIVQQQSNRGTTLFRNAGSTDQFGLEASAGLLLIDNAEQFLSRLQWQLSYTHHAFSFKNYIKDGEDFSGNNLTGVAPNILVSSVSAQTKPGIYGRISYNFTDKIPLNDANSVFSNSYQLIQAKIGMRTKIAEGLSIDIFAGIDNLLDETYSLGNDLNAFGDRFFQPAAARNWFAGIKINLQ